MGKQARDGGEGTGSDAEKLYAAYTIPREHVGWHDPNIVGASCGWVQLDMEKLYTGPEAAKPALKPLPRDVDWNSDVPGSHATQAKIVILIASLRETRLASTIVSAFRNAKFPDRISFGVVQQNDASDKDIVEEACAALGTPVAASSSGKRMFDNPKGCPVFDRLNVKRMDVSEAAGPVYVPRAAGWAAPRGRVLYADRRSLDIHTRLGREDYPPVGCD